MTRSGPIATKTRPAALPRLLMSLVLLFAFGLQSYLFQTHIHVANEAGFASSASPQKQAPKQLPDDPANCPICQQILHSGQFVTPAASLLLLPSLAVSIIAIVVAIAVPAPSLSHGWQSRAPPAH